MTGPVRRSSDRVDGLAQRLEARRSELEQATLARVHGIADPAAIDDPEYLDGLHLAVSSAIAYGIAGIEPSEALPVPIELLSQAQRASRNGIDLDIVLRRCFAGYMLLTNCLIEEVAKIGRVSNSELTRLLGAQAALLDNLFVAVSKEYNRDAHARNQHADHRRAECVRRLLAGELIDPGMLGYDLDAWHMAAVASGPGTLEALRDLATAMDSRLLLVRGDEATAWAWFGSGSEISVFDALRRARATWPAGVPLALGEPGEGVHGWRRSHRQAVASMSVAQRRAEMVSYADVALLASALRDDLLSDSLRERYLAPLVDERDGGATLRRTLQAYFAAERNVSSTAAALDVSRQTVSIRLRAVEEKIGRPLHACAAELEIALRLVGLDSASAARRT